MSKTTFDKNLSKGYLASISRTGRLWLSKLCAIEYCDNCDFAIVSYNEESDCIEIYPFSSGGCWINSPDEFALIPIEDNGVVASISWVRQMAETRGLFGQYIPNYNKEKSMIGINLKERMKKYGK